MLPRYAPLVLPLKCLGNLESIRLVISNESSTAISKADARKEVNRSIPPIFE